MNTVRLSRFLLPLLMTFLAVPVFAAGDTNEVWISARTNALGTNTRIGSGAIQDPYWGDFDFIVTSIPAASTIHLLPGIHYTKGNLGLRAPNQRILGGGIDVTIVRQDHRFNATNDSGMIASYVDGTEIADLTLDCAANGTEPYLRGGVGLRGNRAALRRVKVINASGNFALRKECFAIIMGKPGKGGIEIEGCQVSAFQGTYSAAIGINGQARVTHNTILLPVLTNSQTQGTSTGFNLAGTSNALIAFNFTYGGEVAVYTDTFSETNLSIVNNSFIQPSRGIYLFKNPGDNILGLKVQNNLIMLNTNLPAPGYYPYGVSLVTATTTNGAGIQDVIISGNTVAFDGSNGPAGTVAGIATSSGMGPRPSNIRNVRVSGNIVDRRFGFSIAAQGYWLSDNMDLAGVPLHVRQISSGSGLALLDQRDAMAFVTGPNISGITLPSAWGSTGRQVTIANQRAVGNLQLSASGGSAIQPPAGVSLAPYQTATFISDGASSWIKQ